MEMINVKLMCENISIYISQYKQIQIMFINTFQCIFLCATCTFIINISEFDFDTEIL